MTTLRDEQSWLRTVSLMVLAAVAIAVALIYTRAVMVPFVLSIFIAYLVAPLVDVMQIRLKMPRWLSVFIAFLVVIGLLTLLGLLIVTSTRGLAASAEIYKERIAGLAQAVFSILDRMGIDLGQKPLVENLKALPLLGMLRTTAGTLVDFLSTGLLTLIFVIYLLIGRHPRKMRTGIYGDMDRKIRRYIVTKVAVSAATGILVGVTLALFGLDLALVFGVMAFLLNFIPSIGSIVSTLLPVPMAIVQFDSIWMIAGVIIIPGVIQLAVGNGVEPKLMGEGLELHPLTILLALVFWGLLWGVVGMLLAAPITAVLKLVLERFEMTRPAASLLAGRLPQEEAGAGA